MHIFSIQQLEAMIAQGRRMGLWGMDLIAMNIPRAQQVCNGIGAAWMPNWARWVIGEICPHLIVISLPHDIEYDVGGEVWDRWRADWHFVKNGLRVAWSVRSWKVAEKALLLWIILRFFGAPAFNYQKGAM